MVKLLLDIKKIFIYNVNVKNATLKTEKVAKKHCFNGFAIIKL